MQKLVYEWLGREFVALSGEGRIGLEVGEQTSELFRRFDLELRGLGLSLDHTIRTRLWGRDRPSRDQGSRARVETLSGPARSASSSYIAPDRFDSDAQVAVDLWAMRPSRPGLAKTVVEYDPPIVPLRYLVWDSLVALSGVTSVLPTLTDQIAEIVPALEGSLSEAGVGWEQVVKVSCFLHRSQRLDDFRATLARSIDAQPPPLEVGFVDGYSSEGKLIEIEVTARAGQ